MAAVMTAKGREMLTGRLKATGTYNEPLDIGWGLNPNTLTAATTDVGLFKEAAEARVAGTSSQVTTTTSNDTYQVTGTITSSSGQTIAEVGLFDSTTKPFSTTWATAPTGTGGTTGTTSASYTPANGTYIQSRGEVIQVSAGSGTTSLTLVRAQNGSTATTMSNGDTIAQGSIPGGSAVTGGNLFMHADHGVTTLAINDSIAYTIKVQFS